MKHKCKRLSTLLLAVCLLLSMAVPAVLATNDATTTYSFDYLTNASLTLPSKVTYAKWPTDDDGKLNNEGILNAAYANGTINSTILYHNFSNISNANQGKTYSVSLQAGGLSAPAMAGDYLAIKIKSPGAGNYRISCNYAKNNNNAYDCDIYILPADTTESAISDKSALTSSAKVGTVHMASNPSDEPMDFTLGDAEEYMVLFYAATNASTGKAYLRPTQMTFLKLGGGTSGENTPSTGDSVDVPASGTFTPVKSEIAAENAIRIGTISKTQTWINPQNGHTILYLLYKGGLMVVYDLNTKEILDTKEDLTPQARAIYVDQDGILWTIGNTRFLYRYDPFTKTASSISLVGIDGFSKITSFNGLGLTGDGNGNLYFGTYNVAYLIKYDTKTNTFTNLMGRVDPNSTFAGFGGMYLDGGFLYADIRGQVDIEGTPVKTHKIIKFDLAKQEIAASVDISECFGGNGDLYVSYMSLVDGVLFASTTSKLARTITVDAETMKLINIEGMENGIYGPVSEKVGNKAYYFGYMDSDPTSKERCLYEYDTTTRKVTQIPEIPYNSTKPTTEVVTIEGSDQLSGPALISYKNGAEAVNIYMFALDSLQTIQYADVVAGSGNRLRDVVTDSSGENIWVGAYGVNPVSQYNIASGEILRQRASYGHQVDALLWHGDYLYVGNYSSATITRLDTEYGIVTPLFTLSDTAFRQERMHALAEGDGKLFGGTVPCKGRNGGVLVWYDLEKELTYVAAGPNPEDVYYTRTYDWQANALITPYTWYNAVTNQVVDFDDNDDGAEDYNITVNGTEQQRFYGLINKQSIKELVYQNGYIYGITTTNGGSDALPIDDNAVIFVYDVEAMKVIQSIDVSQFIEGLPTPVPHIDALAADPDVEGKLWGVVCDTLFSFTFDAKTGTFNIQEELSFGKSKHPSGSGWQGRDILFDGDYMYVAFNGSTAITTMINKTNPTEYYIIANEAPSRMALGADDNLYFINFSSLDLHVLRIADQTAPIKDPSEAARAQALINALDDAANITMEDEAAVLAARAAYDKLTEAGKAMVTDISKLTAAEAVITSLRPVAELIAQIDAIGTVTLESKKAITAARDAYNALSDSQKALVTNLNTLTAAESALNALENPTNPVVTVVLIVLTVVVLAAIAVFIIIKRKRK